MKKKLEEYFFPALALLAIVHCAPEPDWVVNTLSSDKIGVVTSVEQHGCAGLLPREDTSGIEPGCTCRLTVKVDDTEYAQTLAYGDDEYTGHPFKSEYLSEFLVSHPVDLCLYLREGREIEIKKQIGRVFWVGSHDAVDTHGNVSTRVYAELDD